MEVIESLGIDNLIIYQDDTLYRFTSDAVILSKFAKAKKDAVVADFCSGSGIVGLHYYALNKCVKSVDLIEIQTELSSLSQKTVTANNLGDKFSVINKPIQQLDSSYNGKYNLILCNPPYKKGGGGFVNSDDKIAMCRHEITVTQEEIIEIASKKLNYGGKLCMCQRVERFNDMLLTLNANGLTPSRIQFVATDEGKEPYLFLIEATKGLKPQLKIMANYINRWVMLYFVATPIGNLDDISFRAIETLKNVDLIACEDTRHSLKLLNHFDIKKPLVAFHKFNEKKAVEHLISELESGKNIAVISDAGMPIISDPGNILTEVLTEKGIEYTVIPGASAGISALVLSGLDASRFTFIGFLPEKSKERTALLNEYKNLPSTLIFYSAPHDINKDLKDIFEVLGDRKVSAVKEITKIHETVYHLDINNQEIEEPKGEFVIVVEGAKEQKLDFDFMTEEEHVKLYLSRGLSKKDAIQKVAKERGISKNALYKYTINDN